jgi:predicted enzyme related to lactoylglutathione lyase
MMSGEPREVKLYVQDPSQAKRFYVEALGLADMPDRSEPPLFYALNAGNYVVLLQDATAAQVEPGAGRGRAPELEFAVDDLEEVLSQVETWGAKAGQIRKMGDRSGFEAEDLDGYRLRIIEG